MQCIFWNPDVVTVTRHYFFQLILLRIAVAFRDCNLLFYVTERPSFPIIVLFLICERHCLSSIIASLAESSWYTVEWLRHTTVNFFFCSDLSMVFHSLPNVLPFTIICMILVLHFILFFEEPFSFSKTANFWYKASVLVLTCDNLSWIAFCIHCYPCCIFVVLLVY